MPVYEYKCTVCDQHFDIEQSFTDDALTSLEGCEVDGDGVHRLKKVFSAVGIAFKGDGFYRNDSRGSKNSSTTGTESATKDTGSGGSNGSDSSSTSSSESSSSESTKSAKSASSSTSSSGGSSTSSSDA